MSEFIHRKGSRGYVVCVAYERPRREYPLYHGPPIDPRYANPYFPGTVVPYAEAADWSHGRPKRIAALPHRLTPDHPSLRCWCENAPGDEIGCPVHDDSEPTHGALSPAMGPLGVAPAPLVRLSDAAPAPGALRGPDEALAERRLDWLGEQAWEPEDWS